jgi:hypothetical protein
MGRARTATEEAHKLTVERIAREERVLDADCEFAAEPALLLFSVGEEPGDARLRLLEQRVGRTTVEDGEDPVEAKAARRDLLGVSRGCTIGAAGLHHPQLAREVEIEAHGSPLVGTDGIFNFCHAAPRIVIAV